MMRRIVSVAAALLLALASTAASAEALKEGSGYLRVNPPQPVSPANKIVVTEFFWYDCPHCAEFEPELEAWVKKLPADVAFERVPVAFAPQYVDQQKIYYALKALGKAEELQGAIFNAIHVQHVKLETGEQMANWLQSHGVAKAQFLNAFNSFAVQMQAKRATQMVSDYQINGVPSMAVQGTYTLSASLPQTPSNEKVLEGVDSLVQQLRQGMAKSAKSAKPAR